MPLSNYGSRVDARGTNFRVFATEAEKVFLCLFENENETRHEMKRVGGDSENDWEYFAPGIGAGAHYGYRVIGLRGPEGNKYSIENKLLLDPFCLAVGPLPKWSPSIFVTNEDGTPNTDDSGDSSGRSVVVELLGTQKRPAKPNHPWRDSFIYEAHVRGLTMLHPDVPDNERGKFKSLAHPAIIEHLCSLGVTALEILPIHAHFDEKHLVDSGLTNYWGYNPLIFSALDPRFSIAGSSSAAISELVKAVDTLHENGIELIVDVVFNHTAENGGGGPVLCYRGLAEQSYYWTTDAEGVRFYVDHTGCGNSFRCDTPIGIDLVVHTLKFFADYIGVDGFRFDLAPILGRGENGFSKTAPFFEALEKESSLANVKMIAEPWDVGLGGYQVGQFPERFFEWNDRFRDDIRRFCKGERNFGSLATRISGSSDLFRHDDISTTRSVNFITAHDGFCLRDLTSYEQKHNEANKEENRDGHNENQSSNSGVEGETEDGEILKKRLERKLNLLSCLLLSRGVPMMLGGDELSHTQSGNNNAYCQDNEITWLPWQADHDSEVLQSAIRQLVALRKSRKLDALEFFDGGELLKADVSWFHPEGREFDESDWENAPSIGMFIGGRQKEAILIIFAGGGEQIEFNLPNAIQTNTSQLVFSSVRQEQDGSFPFEVVPESVTVFSLGFRAGKNTGTR